MTTQIRRYAFSGAAALALTIGAGLAVAGSGVFDHIEVAPGANFGAYESVYVAPVQTAFDSGPPGTTHFEDSEEDTGILLEQEVGLVANQFHNDLVAALGQHYSIAGGPGPSTLTVEATLLDVTPNIDLQGHGGRVGSEAFARSGGVGGASMQVQVSGDDGVLLSASDTFKGMALTANSRATTRFGDAYRAFDIWSEGLANELAG